MLAVAGFVLASRDVPPDRTFVAPEPERVDASASHPAAEAPPPARTTLLPQAQETVAPGQDASPGTPPIQRTDWSLWLDAANDGDAVAACRLSALLDDCRLAGEVERMIDTQVSMAASQGADSPESMREIAALEVELDPLRTRCAVLPDALHAQNWTHLMRSAIAGHEPSMLRFLLDPPIERLHGVDQEAAIAAYRANASLFLSALLQRASPEALAVAYRIAQGEEFLPGIAVRPRDAEAAVRWGSALLIFREDDPATLTGVESALAQLDPAVGTRAQAEAKRLVLPFLDRQRALESTPNPDSDECRRGWPGRE